VSPSNHDGKSIERRKWQTWKVGEDEVCVEH